MAGDENRRQDEDHRAWRWGSGVEGCLFTTLHDYVSGCDRVRGGRVYCCEGSVCVSDGHSPPGMCAWGFVPSVCCWAYLCHRRPCKPGGLGTLPRAPPRLWVPPPLIPVLVGGERWGGAGQQMGAGARAGCLGCRP